jgi:nucleoside-diphosphate-sugar epimerase
MKVLLTGGRGFVATHLEHELKLKGYDVINVSRSTDRTIDDILESQETFDFYIHSAGLSIDSPFSELKPYILSNVDLTKDIFARFEADRDAKRFIFFSSMYALDNTSESTAYAKSKALAEEYLKNTQDARIQILRPALICSPPTARGILGPLQKVSRKGLGIRFPRGFGISWVSIKTVMDSIMTTLNDESFSKELNLIDSEANLNRPKEWVLGFDVHSPKLIIPLSLFFLKIVFGLGHSFKLPFNKHFLRKLQS